ncbi:hypothetical protein NA57DRAFT_14253, partial [Rhizodiscina lignyota]
RYAGFDTSAFSLYSNGSPAQARRALEAHLAETERRLQEASQLGSALVRQRSELAEKLKEVQAHDDEHDIGPDLRQKLVDLEKEFNEVGKETARAFIPKPRVPSNESTKSTEAVLEVGGRDSPTKVQPPSLNSRKLRNQAPGRINDIKLATEISSSLLNQVRELQMAYADKDDALKAAMANKSQLELELEGVMQRLRALDESEQRYKDENWSLETRVQELVAAAKESTEREQKLQQGVKSAQSDKSNVERELEELKQAHGKLNEQHTTARKHHEAEVLSLKKTATTGESERATLQRKLEDLTSQNQELAKAVAYKFRPQDASSMRELTPEDEDGDGESQLTPDNSPPPSPTKGTPRHGALESETLKSSLHHAHRMIQNLKNNIHREKTEKLELRRMLQDARDELDIRRSEAGNSAAKKRKSKDELKEFKKPARPDRLGVARGPTSEIVMDDEWEDQDASESPSRVAAGKALAKKPPMGDADSTDAFETATENSDAFETATEHERNTETDAFHTGVESLAADSSDDLTETEAAGSTGTGRRNNRPSMAAVNNKRGHERADSYQSTASTSGDEFEEVRTPVQSQSAQKFKARLAGRGSLRKSTPRSGALLSDSFKDSPASVASGATGTSSAQSTPQGPSLFAELGDFDASDDESPMSDTPSRSLNSLEIPPEVQRKLSPLQHSEVVEEPVKSQMVDSAMMTESWQPSLLDKGKELAGAVLAGGIGFGLGRKSEDAEPREAEAGAEQETEAPEQLESVEPQAPMSVQLGISEISAVDTEPVDVPTVKGPEPVQLGVSEISAVDTEPVDILIAKAPQPAPIQLESVQPATTPPVQLDMSQISAVDTQPVDVPIKTTEPAQLVMSQIHAVDTEPVDVPTVKPTEPVSRQLEAVAPETSTPVQLGMSEVYTVDTEPMDVPVVKAPVPIFSTPGISSQDTAPQTPVKAADTVSTPFSISNVIEQYESEPESPLPAFQPINEQQPSLAMSSMVEQQTEPIEAVEPERPSTAKRIAFVESADAVPPVPMERPAGFFGMLGLGKSKATPGTPPIAEDETSTRDQQPLRVYSDDIDDGFNGLPGLENTRTPMKEIEPNAVSDRSPKKEAIALAKSLGIKDMADEGTQTMMSADDLDKLMRRRSQQTGTALISPTVSSPTKLAQSPTKAVFGSQSPRRSRESVVAVDAGYKAPRRPGSSGSVRSRAASPPPLPADHKQAIAAAAQRVSGVPMPAPHTPGQMGPPMMPASAYKTSSQYRPPTASSYHGNTPTPRASARAGHRSGVSSPVTRRSSVSSFASEIDQRFNITRSNLEGNLGFEGGTDPRMIQAITQTMIGEFLWKYTRKPGRETQSNTRHRRFFWVHPYTRTLYWSEQDPATAGRAQLKAKSVRIQAVRVVSDDNPFPPGLHRKSLVVVTPGREIMFTAATSGRHETWFNALSYLLLRAGPEREETNVGDGAGNEDLTAEDVDEFNPRSGFFGGATSKMSRRSRASLSSYNSRTTRNSSPPRASQYPTLTPNDRPQRSQSTRRANSQTPQPRGSISGRLSSLAGTVMGNSFSSRYSGVSGQHAGQTSSHDSAEDLRKVIERQEREADRLENVRACCDGKHDVGSLSHMGKRGRHGSHRHS